MTDADFLRQAIDEGNKVAAPYNFGAVVVKDGKVVAIDHAHVHETNNPSLHAEISAIAAACQVLGSYHIDGAVLYASHEPCVMCFSCAAWAHFDRLVYAAAASEQDSFLYEFQGVDLGELSRKLTRTIIVEHGSL